MRISPRIAATSSVLFLWAGLACADLNISLITISPGPDSLSSFGHSAVTVTDTANPKMTTVYEYGMLKLEKVFLQRDPMAAMQQLLESKVPTNVTKRNMMIDQISKLPSRIKFSYLNDKAVTREVRTDALKLSQEQAKQLVELMDKDIAAGQYNYDNFKKNCVTGIRDRLFGTDEKNEFNDGVLGKAAHTALDNKIDTSFQKITLASIDEAVALSQTKVVDLLPSGFATAYPSHARPAMMMLATLGIPNKFKSGKEFYDSFKTGDELMKQFAGGTPLSDAFHNYFFSDEIVETPISEFKATFTPKRLRAALVKVSVIDESASVVKTTANVNDVSTSDVPAVVPAPAAVQK